MLPVSPVSQVYPVYRASLAETASEGDIDPLWQASVSRGIKRLFFGV